MEREHEVFVGFWIPKKLNEIILKVVKQKKENGEKVNKTLVMNKALEEFFKETVLDKGGEDIGGGSGKEGAEGQPKPN